MYFQIYKDSDGDWRFRLKALNGEIIATGEGYRRKATCLAAIELIKCSQNAPVRMVRKGEE